MIGINIDVPASDIAAMNAAFARYVAYYRGNVMKAIEKTMVQIIKSLRASTKVSARIRPIVENPDKRWRTDARVARLGVYKYSNKKNPRQYFSPIKGTGEYGSAVRYVGRNKALMRVLGKWEIFTRQELEAAQLGDKTIQNHPKRVIGRSGLAKASWGWVLGKLGASMATQQAEISGAVRVVTGRMDGSIEQHYIEADNRIKYMRQAMKSGALGTVISRATNNMRYAMGEIVRESRTKSGLRAA